jgi:predicted CXXCH cytochrome family protein
MGRRGNLIRREIDDLFLNWLGGESWLYMSNSVNCRAKHHLKAGACLVLAAFLIGCGPPTIVNANQEGSDKSSQGNGNSIPSAAPAAVPAKVTKSEKIIAYRNISGGVRFVGSEACAPCHLKIYRSYMRTPHGQAATLPSQRPELRNLPAAGITICEKDNLHCFRVFREGHEYYMSEFEPGPNGSELSKETERIAYALGQPMAGTGYIIRRGNYLFEAPLSYYFGSQDAYPKGWGLSPGYEKDPLGFARPLVGSCMYCHVGRPLVEDDANNLYKNPPFGELTVGCENCHGPGGLHVDEQLKHVPISGKIDTSIVNPAHLSSRLSDDTCMYCHEFGEARIPQPGKKFEDFVAGTPLLNTMTIFKSRPIMGWNMMEWSDELSQSKCYRESGGRMSCSTCHDGHYTPTPQVAPAFYRSKCLGCHKETSCRETPDKRHHTTPSDNCASCHMPKHVAPRFVMLGTQGTSHRIVKYEGEPLPEAIAQAATPDPVTGLILVNGTPCSQNSALSPLVLLQAYQSVLARSPNRTDISTRYEVLLDQLAKSDPDNVLVLSALAKRELTKQSAQGNVAAQSYLSRAVERGSRSPQDYMLLAELLYRSGQRLQTIATLKRAVSLFPYIPTSYENLAVCYMAIGDRASSQEIVKSGLSIFPSDPNLRALQSKLGVSP